MTDKEIKQLIYTRLAIFEYGNIVNHWKPLEDDTKIILNYYFYKTGQLAYYNLIIEAMKREHTEPKGMYNIFKLPTQIEKELAEYIKNNQLEELDSKQFLENLNNISVEHTNESINIGNLSTYNIDTLCSLCAAHYIYSFLNNQKSYPYFD